MAVEILHIRNLNNNYRGTCTREEWERFRPRIKSQYVIDHIETVNPDGTVEKKESKGEAIPDPPEAAAITAKQSAQEEASSEATADADGEASPKPAKRGRKAKDKA